MLNATFIIFLTQEVHLHSFISIVLDMPNDVGFLELKLHIVLLL